MKLHEHAEFNQAILAAAEHFKPRGLRASFIEEDYAGHSEDHDVCVDDQVPLLTVVRNR
ncbi:MAG: hypothetical protein AB7G17_00920 [Phycisphaerales bacterium]